MLKSLEINSFVDGYKAAHTSCLDIPIAGGASYFNYDNYFYYSFYYSLLMNWTAVRLDNFLPFRNKILNKLGLALKENKVTDTSAFLTVIKEHIDREHPILLPVRYSSLFYSIEHYLENSIDGNHGLLITGYDADKSVVILREAAHIWDLTNNILRGHSLWKLQLTESMLAEIWKVSNDIFREKKPIYYHKLYTIEKISAPKINSYYDLMKDFIDNYDFRYNALAFLVKNFDVYTRGKQNFDTSVESFRRTFCESLTVIFDTFEKMLDSTGQNSDIKKEFGEFKNNYQKYRYKLISKLHLLAIRREHLDGKSKKKMIEEIRARDDELRSLFVKVFSLINKTLSDNHRQEINYALNAKTSSDSGLTPSNKAVDGKWEDPEHDLWMSDALNTVHWLGVDLGETRTIKKFVIKHINIYDFITRDFVIQGSNDAQTWDDLITIVENNQAETIHEIPSVSYRHIRLYITRPSLSDNKARIYEFEAWG